jgi:uracil-DNA glycosylase
MLSVPSNWVPHLCTDGFQATLRRLEIFLNTEKAAGHMYFPSDELIFHALACTPYDKVKVVVVGQDPYHGPSQAHGLSFSVPRGIPLPPSLKNIYKELQDDLHIPPAHTGNLTSWALQGVLLLNATLTVRQGEPLSHHNRGWEEITDAIIDAVAKKTDPVVFLLWGKNAQEKCGKFSLENKRQHLVLKAAHPSPFSAYSGFMGCRHFSKTNAFLRQQGVSEINWRVDQGATDEMIDGNLWDFEIDEETI